MIGRTISVRLQITLWLLLLGFWIIFSENYHPTMLINILVTTVLLSFYAAAVYLNFLVLFPRFWKNRKFVLYCSTLFLSMIVLTFIAFAIIRGIYTSLWDPNQLGDYWQHFVIDLFGMAAHLLLAGSFLQFTRRLKQRRKNTLLSSGDSAR